MKTRSSKKMTLMQDRTSECGSDKKNPLPSSSSDHSDSSSDDEQDCSNNFNHLQPMEETKELPAKKVTRARDYQTVHAALQHPKQVKFTGCERKRTEKSTQIAENNLTKQLGKQKSKKEEDKFILGYDKIVRNRTQNKGFSEIDKAYKKEMSKLKEDLSGIDKNLDSEEYARQKKLVNQKIASRKSRHNKLVGQKKVEIELQNEKQKSAVKTRYIKTIFEVM